jgi:hypothetical protein
MQDHEHSGDLLPDHGMVAHLLQEESLGMPQFGDGLAVVPAEHDKRAGLLDPQGGPPVPGRQRPRLDGLRVPQGPLGVARVHREGRPPCPDVRRAEELLIEQAAARGPSLAGSTYFREPSSRWVEPVIRRLGEQKTGTCFRGVRRGVG